LQTRNQEAFQSSLASRALAAGGQFFYVQLFFLARILHHIIAAQGTSQNRDLNANMAESLRLL